MSQTETNSGLAAHLSAVREEIRKRVSEVAPEVPEAAPAPVEQLRQAAQSARSLASAIGTVNPRPAGLVNSAVQAVKEAVARLLDWHVRPQREFNHAAAECFLKTAELLEVTSRNLELLAASFQPYSRRYQELAAELDRRPERHEQRLA